MQTCIITYASLNIIITQSPRERQLCVTAILQFCKTAMWARIALNLRLIKVPLFLCNFDACVDVCGTFVIFTLGKKCMHQNKILSRLKAAVLKSLHQLLNHPATCAYLHTFFAHFLACVNAYANTCTKMHKNGKKEKCMQQFCHKKNSDS